MTPATTPPSSPASSHLDQRLDLESIRFLISIVNYHTDQFLSDPIARKSLQLKCSTTIAVSSDGYCEFSEHSVLSNLYWGIESIEAAIGSDCWEERTSRLVNSEKMLQVPALLEEDRSTAGVENRYIICCSYFYLSLVRKLQGDEWQMTMHLLQSLLVSPSYFRTELAPSLWDSLFGSLITSREDEEANDAVARQQGRRYKDWLMYYQVLSYGETPSGIKGCLVADNCVRESPNHQYGNFTSTRCLDSLKQVNTWTKFQADKMINSLQVTEDGERDENMASASSSEDQEGLKVAREGKYLLTNLDEALHAEAKKSFDIRRLQDILEQAQSNSPESIHSHIASMDAGDSEARIYGKENADLLASFVDGRDYPPVCSSPEHVETFAPELSRLSMHEEACEAYGSYLLPQRSHSSLNNLRFSILDVRYGKTHPFANCYVEHGMPPGSSPTRDSRCFSNFSYKFRKRYSLSDFIHRGSFARKKINFSISERDWSDGSSSNVKDTGVEMLGRFEKAVSSLHLSEGPTKCEDVEVEVTTLWELLKNKTKVRYSSVKQEILDQLLDIISSSKKEKVLRASVSILIFLISEDKTIADDIKKKNLHLHDLASVLKRNVHEAAILIYLLNPSPSEIKSLGLLPALVEIACNSSGQQKGSMPLPLTPTSASIAMIEILVTAFDYVTNNMHLAAISSPQILSKLVNIAMNKNLEEGIALAAILVRCIRLNGNCKKFLSQVTPVDPFLHLLRSNEWRAKFAALEYFHEILQMPRSSAIRVIHQIRKQGGIKIMHILMACIQQPELEHRLLAANLLLQLDMMEGSSGKSIFREEAMEVLLESVSSEENSCTQALSSHIFSNLGGTYSWTGESYTAAWLVRKAGLLSAYHRNMIKNVDWLDPCLQDTETEAWSGKTARGVIKKGISVFNALSKGVKSKIKSVSRDCLISIAWLGIEMAATGPSSLRYSACEILLNEIAQSLHPGSEFDERILACLCVYNYTSGKGKQKLINFSEGLRESLRRLSGITWMAEELLKVTDFFLPSKPRVSCVHTQILELSDVGSGAATALIFYKGQLLAGYSDGSIKAWDIKGQRAVLAWEVKEHKRPVTCFALSEAENFLLSGSSDKTIRVWKTMQRKLECVEMIGVKEPIQRIEAYGDKILVMTQSRGLKVFNASRSVQNFCKSKHIKCLAVDQGKIYVGCTDSSIQEVDILEDKKKEIRTPAYSWRMQKKPINSVMVYKGWLYCAGSAVEGSSVKDWRRHCQPQVSIAMTRGTSVQAMAVVEDFIYVNSNSSPSIIQIWLRGKQQKVGRLSAGSKITSLLTANDTLFCGSDTGLIKGWIPL